MSDREILLLALLAGAGGLLWYSRTAGGASVLSDVTDSIAGAFMNRGVRNCNPGNIERSSIKWNNSFQTQAACEAAGRVWDDTFVVFYTMFDGERALGHDIDNAINGGFNTPSAFAEHYAPAADSNDTPAYAQNLASALGIDVGDQIDPSLLVQMTAQVMKQETGFVEDFNTLTSAVYSA